MPGDVYDDAVGSVLGQDTSTISNNVVNSVGTSPAQEGEFRHLAAASNVPIDAVRADPAPIRQKVAVAKADVPGMVTQYPHLAAFMADPSQATLAQNDTDNLKALEQSVTQWNPSLGERIHQWLGEAFNVPGLEQARAANTRAAQQAGMTFDQAREAVGGMSIPGLGGAPRQLAGETISGLSLGLIPNTAGAPTTSGEALGAGAGQFLGFLGTPVQLAEKGVEKLGIGALEHVAGESWAKALARDIGRQGAVLGGATGVGALGDVINSPDVATAATKEATAVGQGATLGTIFGAFGRLLPDNTALQALGRFLGISSVQNATHGQLPFGEYADWDKMDPVQRTNAVFNTALNAFFSRAGAGRTSGGWWHDAAKADIATDDYHTLDTLSRIAMASEVRQHDPEAFGNFVDMMLPKADLYVDGKIFAEALQQSGTPLAELQKVLPGVADRLVQAQALEKDVRVPFADYMAHIAGMPLGDALLQHLKTDPDGMTYAQAQEHMAGQVESLKQEAQKGLQTQAEKDAWETSHAAVEDDLKAKLAETGRFTPDVNAVYAKLMASMNSIAASRGERTPEEQYAKYPLDVRSFVGGGAGASLDQPPVYTQVESPEFKAWSNNAPYVSRTEAATRDFKTGERVVVEAYHGTGRPDRVGSRFRKSRATSGPMAFHTSDPELASRYATGKPDTSLYEEDQSYDNWYKYKPKGARSTVDIARAWYHLDAETKARIAKVAPTLRLDDDGKLISEPGNRSGNGSYDYNLKEARGNPLKALVEDWLNSGLLFGEEEKFGEVLKAAGVPMKDVTYDSPHDTYPFVYKNYISMQKPLVTRDLPPDVVAALEAAAKHDRSRATPGADPWAKTGTTLRGWLHELKDPTMSEHAWTHIPDKVTAVLKSLGYDGIIDSSGKGGGEQHPVYVPFDETQVKSAVGNKGTFDTMKTNILYQDEVEAPTVEPFYSELARQVDAANMKAAPAQGWKEWLKSLASKGVKPDEIKWSGIEEFLDAHDGKVTKEEVQQFLQNNGVKVITVERGEPNYRGPRTEDEFDFDFRFRDWETEEPDESYISERAHEQFDEAVEQRVDEDWRDFEDQAREGLIDEDWKSYLDQAREELHDEHGEPEGVDFEADDLEERARALAERDVDMGVVEDRARELAEGDIDKDRLLERLEEQERQYYYEDYDSPQTRHIDVDVNGHAYEFDHSTTYGEERLYGDGNDIDLPRGRRRGLDDADIEAAIREYLTEHYDLRSGATTGVLPTKWGNYVTGKAVPGSYREILLTLPEGAVGRPTSTGDYKVFNRDNNYLSSFPTRALAEAAAARIEGGRVEAAKPGIGRENVPDFHYDTHFPEANILGHFRLDEHRDAEGNRIMVVQEVQGDWGQHFREAQADVETHAKIEAAQEELRAHSDSDIYSRRDAAAVEAAKVPLSEVADSPVSRRFQELDAELTAHLARREQISDEITRLNGELHNRKAVPEGPFIAKTTGWAALVAKRIVAYAVEHGFDKVVWTSGAQQVERWASGLRQQVDKIAWAKTPDGQIHIVASQRGAERANTLYAENQISDAIGKAMAKQIIGDPNQSGEITGSEITISDTGMVGFYDKMLPNIFNEVLKKLDKSVRVSEHSVNAPEYEVFPREIPGGQQVFTVKQVLKRGDYPEAKIVGNFRTEAEAQAAVEAKKAEEGPKNIGTQLGFPITDKIKESAAKGLPLFQRDDAKQAARGQITFGNDITKDTSVIALLQNADLSTFLHELGHYNLAVMAHMASEIDANPKVRDDMDTVLKWLNVPDLETWNAMSLDQQRPYHEQFARGFEKYLFEGKSPSLQMQGIFSRMRAWLLHVYQQLTALKVDLTPEVRGVFDRLVASEAEIKQAQDTRGMARLFADKPEGMSDEDWHGYVQTDKDATETALSMQQTRSLRDMKWLSGAKARVTRDLQRAAAGYRKEAVRDATAQIGQETVYRAEDWLTKGTMTDEEGNLVQVAPEARQGAKLNRAEVDSLFPPGDPSRPDLTPLRGMVSDKGLPLDTVSEMFGASSGRELVNQLLVRTPRSEAIRGLADQMMLERHGEMHTPDQIERSAEAAVHNELRARVIASEWRTLARVQGSPLSLARAAAEAAEATIAQRRIVDIKAREYEAAETRASKAADAAMKKDDPVAAAQAKRTQLLNNRLAKSARDALDGVDKAVRYFKKFDRPAARERLPGQFVEQIDAILGQFDLRRVPNDINRPREALLTWANALREAGYEPQIADWLTTMTARTPYRNLTVEEMRGVYDAVRSIEQTGRSYSEIVQAGKRVALRTAVDNELTPKMDERGEHFTKADLILPVTAREHGVWAAVTHWLGVKLRLVDTDLVPQEFKFNKYDMHEFDGPFREYLLDPMFAANYDKVKMTKAFNDAAAKMGAILGKDWQKSMFDKMDNRVLLDPRLSTPGAPVLLKIDRATMLGIARHVGNESNFEKLTKGWNWQPADVMRFLAANMTAKDVAATNAHWASFDPLWARTEAMITRLSGVKPPKIPARPFDLALAREGGGVFHFEGGYSPIDYDPVSSRLTQRKGEFDLKPGDKVAGENMLYRATTTKNGSLITRSQGYTDLVNLDFHSAEGRIRDTIHDLAYREALLNATKIVNDARFREKFMLTYGKEEYQALTTWLKNVRDTYMIDPHNRHFDAAMAYARQGVVLTGIAYRLSTVAKHGSAAALKSLGYLGNAEGAKYFAARVTRMASGHLQEEIAGAKAKFPEIMARSLQMDRDYKQGNRSMYEGENWREKNDRYGHAMVAWSDLLSAVPTAWAAYDLAKTSGVPESMGGTGKPMSEEAAVRYANSTVRQAHGTALEVARSNFLHERGIKGLFGTLYGFMNNTYGQQRDMFDKAFTQAGFTNNPALVARATATLVIPALLTHWLVAGGQHDEESWYAWIAKAIGAEIAATVPFVRDAASMLEFGKTNADVAPVRLIGDVIKAGKDAIQEAQGESSRIVQDLANAVGEWAHIGGLGQLGHSLQYLRDVYAGKQTPQSVPEAVKGATVGAGHK